MSDPQRLDFFRWPAPWAVAGSLFKEWQHFCIYGPTADVLVNISLVETGPPLLRERGAFGRVITLVRAPKWQGQIARFEARDFDVERGRIDISLGAGAKLSFDGMSYRLQLTLERAGIAADLRLQPVSIPAPAYEIDVEDGPAINWVVFPRLLAWGTVEIGGHIHHFDGALAYHDHNWGHFHWGSDFSWEWGYGLPRDPNVPWSLVFVRLSDRAHRRTLMQGAFVWRDGACVAVFRDSKVSVRRNGLLRSKDILKVPPVLDLAHPGSATDVPQTLTVTGRDGTSWVEACFDSRDIAQVLIPNDTGPGITVINEVSAGLRARGEIAGRPLSVEGGAIFEYLGS